MGIWGLWPGPGILLGRPRQPNGRPCLWRLYGTRPALRPAHAPFAILPSCARRRQCQRRRPGAERRPLRVRHGKAAVGGLNQRAQPQWRGAWIRLHTDGVALEERPCRRGGVERGCPRGHVGPGRLLEYRPHQRRSHKAGYLRHRHKRIHGHVLWRQGVWLQRRNLVCSPHSDRFAGSSSRVLQPPESRTVHACRHASRPCHWYRRGGR